MDSELRFIAALLRSNGNEQDRFFTQQIPKGVFTLRQKEIFWLYRYREKHGRYPSPNLFRDQFQEQLPKVKDPLSACLQPILDRSMYEQMKRVIEQAKEKVDQNKIEEGVALFKEGATQLSAFNVDYVDIDFAKSRGALSRYRETIKTLGQIDNKMIDTPWPTANRLVHFFRPGETIVVVSRTSIGKTWMVVNWAHWLAKKKIETLFISKEMPSENIEDRMEALQYFLPYDKFRSGNLPPKILRKWKRDRQIAIDSPLYISGDETLEGTGLSHVASKILRYRPRVVFVDGAYLLRAEGAPRNASQVDLFRMISNRLKTMAKFFKVVIVIVLQLNRKAEQKGGESKGGLGDIYGSDSWAQDTDSLWIIHGKRGGNMRKIEIAKGRESNVGEFTTKFQLDPYPCFEELSGKNLIQSTGTIKFKGVA